MLLSQQYVPTNACVSHYLKLIRNYKLFYRYLCVYSLIKPSKNACTTERSEYSHC